METPSPSIPPPQPVLGRAMFGAAASAAPHLALSFVSAAALEDGLAERLGLARRLVAVADTREIGKRDLPNNDAAPEIRVDPETFVVSVDGEPVDPAPADELPLAQRYSLF